ncbi:hypothetical protein, partial [Ralstonia solanacearum]
MIGIANHNTAPSLGKKPCMLCQTLLITPREDPFVVLHKTVVSMRHCIWWVEINKIIDGCRACNASSYTHLNDPLKNQWLTE